MQKPKGPVGAGGCKGSACRRFGQRKGRAWRSLCKAQPLAAVKIRVKRKTDLSPIVVGSQKGCQGES